MNGNDDYRNTLPDPVYPNAKTGKEMFCKDYTKDQLKSGILVVDSCFDDIEASDGILTLDSNKDVFKELMHNCAKSYITVRGYDLFYDYQDELFLYFKIMPNDIHKTAPKIVIVELHSPLCVIGDSDYDKYLSPEIRIKRAGSALFCQNFRLGYQDKSFSLRNMDDSILWAHHFFDWCVTTVKLPLKVATAFMKDSLSEHDLLSKKYH